MSAHAIKKSLRLHTNKNKSSTLSRFFKTGKGEYGYGDRFLGVSVPLVRKVVKPFYNSANLTDVETLFKSKYHEERLAGVFLLNHLYTEAVDTQVKTNIFKFYVAHTGFNLGINNWDLIDSSADKIIGDYISNYLEPEKIKKFVDSCIRNQDLWIRRMIVLATYYDIKKGNPDMVLYVAEQLLDDEHDLIHKSVGWMLREMGKRISEKPLRDFLRVYKLQMPRTMYRYAIERLS